YDVLCFEDLNLQGMKALWGRKVSDLGFGQFMEILEWAALKRGKQVVKIDRWYPSTQLCHVCHHQHTLITLRAREWECPNCRTHHIRDHNAAINILCAGASAPDRSDDKTRTRLRSRVEGRSSRL